MRETEARDRLAAMYDECAPRVYAYALRHCGPVDADDVVAETFTVAWRRIDVVPDPAIGWHPWAHLEEEDVTFRDSGVTLEFLDASGRVVRTADGPLA